MKNKDEPNYKVYFSVNKLGFIIYTIILFVFYFGMTYSILEPDWKPIGLKITEFLFFSFVVFGIPFYIFYQYLKDFLDTPYIIINENGIYIHRHFSILRKNIDWSDVYCAFFEYRIRQTSLCIVLNRKNEYEKIFKINTYSCYFENNKNLKSNDELLNEICDFINLNCSNGNFNNCCITKKITPKEWEIYLDTKGYVAAVIVFILYIIANFVAIVITALIAFMIVSPIFIGDNQVGIFSALFSVGLSAPFVLLSFHFLKKFITDIKEKNFDKPYIGFNQNGLYIWRKNSVKDDEIFIDWRLIFDADIRYQYSHNGMGYYYIMIGIIPYDNSKIILEYKLGSMSLELANEVCEDIQKIISDKDTIKLNQNFPTINLRVDNELVDYSFLLNK